MLGQCARCVRIFADWTPQQMASASCTGQLARIRARRSSAGGVKSGPNASNGRSRREAAVADRGLERLNWAESGPTGVSVGPPAVRAKARTPLGARIGFAARSRSRSRWTAEHRASASTGHRGSQSPAQTVCGHPSSRDARVDARGAAFGEAPNVAARPARDHDPSPVSELVLIEPAKERTSRVFDGRGRPRGDVELAPRIVADELEAVGGRAVVERQRGHAPGVRDSGKRP